MLRWTLRRWFRARRQEEPTTGFQATHPIHGRRARAAAGNLIFRLKSWPQLPESGRTAEIYRMLSVMSSQPVNRHWLLARSQMAPQQLDELLARWVADGALEVIDPARFAERDSLLS